MGSNVLTMITRHGTNDKNITGYTLISSDYHTVTVTVAQLIKSIKDKKVELTNLELNNGNIESTNGSMNNYTLIDSNSGNIIGDARAVVLDRIEKNDSLIGYTVFMPNGSLAELSVKDVVDLANKKLISNGKIRHTQDGDIVASIGGNYPLREINVDKAPDGDLDIKALYFASVGNCKYVGAMISSTSAAQMTKVMAAVRKSNKLVIETTKKLGNKNVGSLEIQRAGATNYFVVIDLALINSMVKSGAKLSAFGGNTSVTAIKYDNGEQYEAAIKLNGNLAIVDESKSGIDELDNEVREYAKNIINYLKQAR